MDRQKLIRMTERSERIYLQQEKTRRGIHLVTACIKLPLGSINQALQKGHGKKLPISCRSCMLNRQEQGERGKGELGCSAHRSLYSPPSMLGVMSMSQQTSGQSGPQSEPLLNQQSSASLLQLCSLERGLEKELKRKHTGNTWKDSQIRRATGMLAMKADYKCMHLHNKVLVIQHSPLFNLTTHPEVISTCGFFSPLPQIERFNTSQNQAKYITAAVGLWHWGSKLGSCCLQHLAGTSYLSLLICGVQHSTNVLLGYVHTD